MRRLTLLVLIISLFSCGEPTIYTVPGPKGDKGDTGPSGQSCSITPVTAGAIAPNGGALVTCGDDSVLLLNGEPGQDGQSPAGLTITTKIDPCGNTPSIDDEVFLLLSDGSLIWLQVDNSSGKNARLAEGTDGSWVTTDGSACHFTISTTGNTRTITWTGGSYSWTL